VRVFCAVRHSVDPRKYYGGLWSANFYPALRELGHEVVESQVDLLPTSRFMAIGGGFTREELEVRAQTTERILEEVREALRKGAIDLFLSYFYNSHFDPSGFDELRRFGMPSINFYCNSIHQFENVAAVAAKADFSWHPERAARGRYLAIGAKPVRVQLGADPMTCRPLANRKRQPRLVFVGQRYADRDRMAGALIKASLPLDLYGAGWGADGSSLHESTQRRAPAYLGRIHFQPGTSRSYLSAAADVLHTEGVRRGIRRLAQQWRYRSTTRRLTALFRGAAKGHASDMAETFARYEVAVNFSNVWADGRPAGQLVPHMRLRDFEAPMCRTCYLTGHTDEIAEFYDLGKEIHTYRGAEELVDKARYYLKHSSAAERLRSAGYARAIRDHTWKRRFEELFRKTDVHRF
jgi:spore maturation protein CgeB